MRALRTSVVVRNIFVLFALTTWIGACHKWAPVASPELVLRIEAEKRPEKRQNLRVHVAEDRGLFEGRFVGTASDTAIFAVGKDSVAIATAEISQIDERRSNTPATVAVALVSVGLVAGLVAWKADLNELDCSGSCYDWDD